MTGIDKQLRGFRLTTAEILYHLPDHPDYLQSFIWQDLDQVPKFPILRQFLDFWCRNLDGDLHSVCVASKTLVAPPRFGLVAGEFSIH